MEEDNKKNSKELNDLSPMSEKSANELVSFDGVFKPKDEFAEEEIIAKDVDELEAEEREVNLGEEQEEEKVSKKDYLKLVEFVYGKSFRDDIADDVDEESDTYLQDVEEITRKAMIKSRFFKYNPKKKLNDRQKKLRKQKIKAATRARKITYKNNSAHGKQVNPR